MRERYAVRGEKRKRYALREEKKERYTVRGEKRERENKYVTAYLKNHITFIFSTKYFNIIRHF